MDDLISRQAALDIFDDYNVAVENGQIEAYSRDRKRLCDLPSAQPEGEKDEWIEAWVSGYPAIHHSRCNAFIYAPNGKKGFNFCPCCGHSMR